MKVRVAELSHNKNVAIDFSHDIPCFPSPPSHRWLHDNAGLLFTRNEYLSIAAAAMACENAGMLPIEFSDRPQAVYLDFLTDLVRVPGFVGIRFSDRYSLHASVGKLFEPTRVGREIAGLLQRHFYPKESLDFECEEKAA